MAKLSIVAGATSQSVNVFIQNSGSTTGAGLTGLVFNTTNLIAYYSFTGANAGSVQITLATLAAVNSAYSSGGFKEIDSTNMAGWYRLDLPNAAITTGKGRAVSIHLSGAANMAPCPLEIELTGWDNQDGVHGGMTALPNAAAAASGGLPVLGTNATAISFTAGMTISNAGGDALVLTSSGSNGNALNASGNGTGAGIKATAGATGNGLQIIGGATSGSGAKISGTAGNAIALELVGQGSATAFSATGGATGPGAKFVGGGTSGDGIDITTTSGDGLSILPTAGNGIVATANGTSKHGVVFTGGTAGTSDGLKAVAGTGGVDIRGNITGNVTGNLSGSAGSVTGAVGSVTGNVGGNVVGSVASVTARVTANTDQWAGGTIPVVNVTGVPLVDLKYTLGTISPATAGSVRADAVTGAVGSVTGAVGSVTGAVGSVTGNVGGNVVGSVASVTADVGITQAAADKVFGSSGAAMAELAQAQPSATPSPRNAMMALYMALRNTLTTTATTKSVTNDAGTVIFKKALSDDGTTYTETKTVTGP